METVSFGELEGLLQKLDARLEARQVHALYLGALTSTSFTLGPAHLLDVIFGEEGIPTNAEDDGAPTLRILSGYWNTLAAARERGETHLPPAELPPAPSRIDLKAYAERRNDEIKWFIRGIDAGGDDPIELGPDGNTLLEHVAEATALLTAYAEVLGRHPDAPVDQDEVDKTIAMFAKVDMTIERILGDLMDVTEDIRREAIETFRERQGLPTDDAAPPQATAASVGRNDPCPCGTGKKWKKCCGSPAKVH